jgi:hypothetical protein
MVSGPDFLDWQAQSDVFETMAVASPSSRPIPINRNPWPGALGASRLLTGLLFEIGPGDIATYMGTIVVLGGVGLISIFIPALRAATAAPLSVLQGE